MKKFNFQLQTLLQLRHQIKEQLFQNWVTANQTFQKVKQEREQLEQKLNNWQENYRQNSGRSMSGTDFWHEQRAASVLRQQWTERSKAQEYLEQRAKAAFMAWQEARKKEEALEKLKDRSKLEWFKDWERQEQKVQDERAGFQFYQNSINSRDRQVQHEEAA